ncbi:hypothetical protein [Arenibacter sp. ARW7G5Y1]|uniref:hypothetical protein n=1 Tax=Arenibacter sp. ARW7G5Y1 TaxID=2135619 RepID=UPI000D75725E|nr:hypothetical protein [Arenibacter sp. ARW7G5Y1]PXX21392.1 hypothetical protein C7972_13513 [Arenibacter sp. ARW7G5Y1]
MGYFTRVFCATKNKPTIQSILDFVIANGIDVSSNLNGAELLTENWNHFELIYDKNRLPLLVELNGLENSDGLAEEELEEFLEFVGKPRFYELKKKKVAEHLKKTEYIICVQLPTNDIVDKGYDANGELMEFFEKNFSGMIQADREGFYDGPKLLLELE